VIPAFVLLPFESACAPSKLYSAINSKHEFVFYAVQTRDLSGHFLCTP
jgi:hypothetical protein